MFKTQLELRGFVISQRDIARSPENARAQQKFHDRLVLESTGRCRQEPLFLSSGEQVFLHEMLEEEGLTLDDLTERTLYKPRKCYICKERYTIVDEFYHTLCVRCAQVNHQRRDQSCDLTGRTALLTGGRIKIGYAIALKLLRCGARVIVTTRFPHDAARRFANEKGFVEWRHRLEIYGLDLKNISSVESFTSVLQKNEVCLDILINNAAQTIRRPPNYYRCLMEREGDELSVEEIGLLASKRNTELVELNYNESIEIMEKDFPVGRADEFGEPIDKRESNSWLSTLEEVSTLELVETQVVNSMAPFLLASRLKPLMARSPYSERFIINVSAMEGQFSRKNKTHRHPHTNMAKAALNMMTRTSAQDYVREKIYMNSVDTGWVTQENPYPVKARGRSKGMVPPLDCVDGAARVLAPVIDGVGGRLEYGKFFKDYTEANW